MENWQFLIQRQGDSSWRPLQSPIEEIIEGRYRVVARSHHANTDVEVRVTHSSTQEVPPKRRVQKRKRRTSSEGLMAVIPFTYLKPGIWELQCTSSDLMSDFIGKSWQYKVHLQVLPCAAGEDTPTASAPVSSVSDGDTEETTVETAETSEKIVTKSEIPIATETAEEDAITDLPVSPVWREAAETSEKIVTKSEIPIATETAEEDAITDLPVSPVWREAQTVQMAIASQMVEEDAITDVPVSPVWREAQTVQMAIATKSSLAEEEAIIDVPVSPVWHKAETAEQILQNLIELALPSSESLLLESETVQDSPAPISNPSLLLNLDAEIYVARWGEALSIDGRVEGKTLNQKNIFAPELRIELRSPQKSEILSEQRQPLAEKLLPFGINCSIEIPADCESNLILADMNLYGALEIGEQAILLASQSFTITADVTQLLAISAAAKQSKPEVIDVQPVEPVVSKPKRTSLDLQLLNLVKTVKTPSALLLQPSLKKLPPQIVSSLAKSTPRSLELPNFPRLPQSQTNSVTFALTPQGDSSVASPPRAVAGTTFPYLRRLKAKPGYEQEEKSYTKEALQETVEDSQLLSAALIEGNNVPELIPDDSQLDTTELEYENTPERGNLSEVTLPYIYESILTPKPYVSPLIQKWMQTQGYSLVEPINLQYQDYDSDPVPTYQTISPDQQLSVIAETPTLIQLQSNIEIHAQMQVNENTENLLKEKDTITQSQSTQTSAVEPPQQQLEAASGSKTKPAWWAQEIVVDDTSVELDIGVITSSESPQLAPITPLPQEGGFMESLPIPQLHVPDCELIAGKSVRVRVELPFSPLQIAVKLWVKDCQTRWLLDGPVWLTNLLPNSKSGLEVTTQLAVPFGCLEISIEAIAVHLASQQESHKVTIVRAVMPDDLPIPVDVLGI